jgi:hypothetical protein
LRVSPYTNKQYHSNASSAAISNIENAIVATQGKLQYARFSIDNQPAIAKYLGMNPNSLAVYHGGVLKTK